MENIYTIVVWHFNNEKIALTNSFSEYFLKQHVFLEIFSDKSIFC